jgi:hypothetical protein
VLAPGGGGDPGKLWVVAELLYLDWVAALAKRDEGAAADRNAKALLLFRRVGQGLGHPEGAPPPQERITTLEAGRS